jgi:hypothetical protein
MAPRASRRSRGVLPLEAAASGKLASAGLADFDPFHLLAVEPGMAALWSWDGEHLTEQELTAGLHIVVNSGLGGEQARQSRRPSGNWPASGSSQRSSAAWHARFRGPAARLRRPGGRGCP